MSARRTVGRIGGLLALAALLAAGCRRAEPALAPPKPPEVIWASPVVRDDVVEYEELTGRTEASLSVDLRARVSGYLEKAPFKEGSDVKDGELLFEIDRHTYQAELDRTVAQLDQSEEALKKASTELDRSSRLARQRAASAEELDRVAADRNVSAASINVAKAAVSLAKLNLGFTRITAPFSGRISRRYVDPGNLVKADDTVLTTLVQLDPIHASFDIDERTVLRLRKLIREGGMASARETETWVDLGLAGPSKGGGLPPLSAPASLTPTAAARQTFVSRTGGKPFCRVTRRRRTPNNGGAPWASR